MKITFQREGHANNSSSSHSLVFVNNDKLRNLLYKHTTSENTEFGWNDFRAEDNNSKLNYLLFCLSYRLPGEKFTKDGQPKVIGKEAELGMINNLSKLLKDEGICQNLKSVINKINKANVYVDHQSHLNFPFKRKGRNIIDWDFARAFIKEAMKPEYVIVGGNDNGGGSIPDVLVNSKSISGFEEIWHRLVISYEVTSAFDTKTGEFILHFGKSIMKIIF